MSNPKTITTPDDLFTPTSEQEVIDHIYEHPLPTYDGSPKRAHNRIVSTNGRLLSGLRLYFMVGRRPGDFLTAVIENKFAQAVAAADDKTVQILNAFSTYLMNYPPRNAWGSREARKAWQNQDGLVGEHDPKYAWKMFTGRKM